MGAPRQPQAEGGVVCSLAGGGKGERGRGERGRGERGEGGGRGGRGGEGGEGERGERGGSDCVRPSLMMVRVYRRGCLWGAELLIRGVLITNGG